MMLLTITEPCLNHEFPRGELRNYHTRKIFVFLHGHMIWRVMPRNVWNDIVSWQTGRFNNSTKCLLHAFDDHHFKEEEMKSVGELSKVCSQIVLKCLYLARIGRRDFLWSVNRLARSITNGPKLVTNAWIVWYLTSITHVNTDNIVMLVILLNNANWDCFKTPILREILKIRNPLLEEHCAFWEVVHSFPISWTCMKQTSVSHSSTESFL